jgi:hypothetical protein
VKKRLFMETTKIEASKTVSEIQEILGRYRASAILTEYENGDVAAVSFRIDVSGNQIPFRLPCRWEPVFKALKGFELPKGKESSYPDSIAWAKRVAWRQILRWIQAQLALTETNMVSIQEVFLPYMQAKNGKTLYELINQNGFKMLEGPK